MKDKIYLAGDLLKKGSQLLREQEKLDLEEIGIEVYSPKDDKEINDKTNQTKESNDGLAEKIVKKDTQAIIDCNTIIIEPTDGALGTICEMGQLKGMRDAYFMICEWLANNDDVNAALAHSFIMEFGNKFNKKVYPHYEDIRRTNIPENGDRRSWSINQYVYGVALDLSEGKGFYEWEEILQDLKKK